MRGNAGLTLVAAFAASAALLGAEAQPAPVKAVGSVELAGLTGKLDPIHGSNGDYAPLDVLKLSVQSDGKDITIAATLRDDPGTFATAVLRLYFDTDNNPKTGGDDELWKVTGFEYLSDFDACVDYERGSACVGSVNGKPTGFWASASLKRVKGKDQFGNLDTEKLVSNMSFGAPKASAHTPIVAKRMEAKLSYADLNVKPGQPIRIVAREQARQPGLFPEILLTLK